MNHNSQDPNGDPLEEALQRAAAEVNPNPNFVSRLAARLRTERAGQTAPRRRPAWAWIGAAVAAVFALALLGRALWPSPDVPPATTIAQPPVVTDDPEQPPAFLADLPPAVATISPQPGQEIAPDGAITLRFTQPMDRATVEQALRITPAVAGDFEWEDDQTVSFRPRGLASATQYQLALAPTALAANGLPLNRELAFSFATFSPLTVTHTSPAHNSRGLRGDVPVLISFNYPVVPLNCTGQVADDAAGCPNLPLVFTPGVVGQGTWINTSIYRFDPLPGWEAGESYTATLPSGVTSVDGAALEVSYTWAFNIAPPRITDYIPRSGASNIPLEEAIRINFNTPMDPASTEAAFTLTTAQGAPVAGDFTWRNDHTQLVFTPTALLQFSTGYNVQLAESAQAIGGVPLKEGVEWRFVTTHYPAVRSVTVSGGEQRLSLYGSLRVTFEGMIDPTTIDARLQLLESATNTEMDFNTWWSDSDSALYIHWDKSPSTEYCLTILPGIADRYGNEITTTRTDCFVTQPLPATFIPATSLWSITLDANATPRLYFVAANTASANLTLARISERSMVSSSAPVLDEVLRRWTVTPGTATNETAIIPVDLTESGSLPTGYYYLSWAIPGESSHYYWNPNLRIAVVDRHVTLKIASEEALVWVTDLQSGAPLAGAPVRLLNMGGTELANSVTDADGIVRFTIGRQRDLWNTFVAISGEAGTPGFGVARSDWNQGVSPWDFDLQVAYYRDSNPFHLYLQTDRPIYRPGHLIHVRGILRQDEDARYSLPPAGQSVNLQLRSPDWSLISEQTIEVSEAGTLAADFVLADDALLGGYTIEARIADAPSNWGSWSLYFDVAAYRKPEFQVTVTLEQSDLLQGETLRALVEASYYAGGPVSNSNVHWVIRARTHYFNPDVPGWWNWGQSGWWSWWRTPEVIAEGRATTDSEGRFLLELPAELAALDDDDDLTSQDWSIEATITDESGFPVTGEGSLTVHLAEFYLGLRPERWVAQAGEPAAINLLALDWEALPVARQEVAISLARRTWQYVQPTGPFRSGEWTHTDTVVETLDVTTDAAGRATFEVTPPSSGSYVVIAESSDRHGNPVRSETYLWAGGPQAAAWRMAEGQVMPIADADSYQPGDTATILLPTPFGGSYEVLMTIERGSILEVQRLTFDTPNPTIELPITEAHVPNIYVSFVIVKGVDADTPIPDVRIGMVELEVEPVRQTLTVEVTPDRDTPYQPGDRVTLTVRAFDSDGNPVDAEVALAVVDKAVLALADPNAPTLLESFYRTRPLGIITGDSSIVLFNRLLLDLEALAESAERLTEEALMGGIGGGGGGEGRAVLDLREDFPDTTYWEAHLRTGPTGEVQVTFDLPDSLTTWVADARAVTDATQVGQTTTEFIVTKPLLVRPVTPRFFVAGDRAEVAAVVHNNTDAAIAAEVTLEALGVTLPGEATQSVNIPAHGRVRVAWPLNVPLAGSNHALLTFGAEGGGYSDRTRPTVGRESDHALPIYRYETPTVFGTTGALTGAGVRLEALIIPTTAGPESSLTVRLEPTLAAAMTESLSYLEHFPHSCTEQLISRFLPNVVTYQALQSLGVEDPELAENLERVVPEMLEQLYNRQRSDGAWGWWYRGSNPDFQTSAYAVLGLLKAQEAGFEVDPLRLNRGLNYLHGVLSREMRLQTQRYMTQAFALYVLAEAEYEWPEGVDAALYEAREQLDATGRAYLTLALGLRDPKDPRLDTLLASLRTEAEITATGAHWQSSDAAYWITWTRATSVVLDALSRFAPDDPLLPQAARWLMVARQANRWETTQETAWAVMALTDYMVATGELTADYTWGLGLNGEALAEAAVTPETLREAVEFTIPVNELLRQWPNALEISRSEGDGTLYYTAHLALYEPVENLSAESRGLTVERQYCAVSGALETPSWRETLPACTPVTTVRPGDLVEVRLTLTLPRMRNYLILEDFYPAGMEPVDPTLNTEIGGAEPVMGTTSRVWWWPRFDHQELRDEKAVFYATRLSAGSYQISYYLRAAVPGEYRVLPATASEMYFPETWGRTAGEIFRIEP